MNSRETSRKFLKEVGKQGSNTRSIWKKKYVKKGRRPTRDPPPRQELSTLGWRNKKIRVTVDALVLWYIRGWKGKRCKDFTHSKVPEMVCLPQKEMKILRGYRL